MHFMATADTDIGIKKQTNQDSVLIKHASTAVGEVLMAVVCDGMGGLAKGELASATVVKAFADWFDTELKYELKAPDVRIIGEKWELMLKELNVKILEYGKSYGSNLGTTFTGVLFIENQYVLVHVGDTRLYHIGTTVNQLTEDQTFIAREIRLGNMTMEEAKTDKRRNMLLQCIGSSKEVSPQVTGGMTRPGTYMLCSDGFRHKITEEEMLQALDSSGFVDKTAMHNKALQLIGLVKEREETDNISVILIKAE